MHLYAVEQRIVVEVKIGLVQHRIRVGAFVTQPQTEEKSWHALRVKGKVFSAHNRLFQFECFDLPAQVFARYFFGYAARPRVVVERWITLFVKGDLGATAKGCRRMLGNLLNARDYLLARLLVQRAHCADQARRLRNDIARRAPPLFCQR